HATPRSSGHSPSHAASPAAATTPPASTPSVLNTRLVISPPCPVEPERAPMLSRRRDARAALIDQDAAHQRLGEHLPAGGPPAAHSPRHAPGPAAATPPPASTPSVLNTRLVISPPCPVEPERAPMLSRRRDARAALIDQDAAHQRLGEHLPAGGPHAAVGIDP